MSKWKEYKEYLADNPKGYWFKRKLYGWGWTPVTREGWIVILVFVLAVLYIAKDITDDTDITEMYGFFAQLAVAITALIFICYKTGEKPKWMWGVPKKDEEEEKEK